MGFFIRDLHEQIQQLYYQQISKYERKSFTVYRGQGLTRKDFDQLVQAKGGLMSFNNFLSTSREKEVSLIFAIAASTKADTVGILFKISIDPTISSTPFASIKELSYYKTEEEILFSMHTIFRIGEVTIMDENNRWYQVELKLTDDNDQQLQILTNYIRLATQGFGWERLGVLLFKIGHFTEAEELFTELLKQTSKENEQGFYCFHIGHAKHKQGDHANALEYYERAQEIYQRILPEDHPTLALCYNNIAGLFEAIGEYSKSLLLHEKTLEIRKNILPPEHPDTAQSNNNIGLVLTKMGQFSRALPFLEKTLEIRQKIFPLNHPDLAQSYNNMGGIYHRLEEYSKGTSFYKKALGIWQRTLPKNHSDLITCYDNLGAICIAMKEYSEAIAFYEKVIQTQQHTAPLYHTKFAHTLNNMGFACKAMKEDKKALFFYEQARDIWEKARPLDNHALIGNYSNIANVYLRMKEYSQALSHYRKVFEIQQKVLPSTHPDLVDLCKTIALLHQVTV